MRWLFDCVPATIWCQLILAYMFCIVSSWRDVDDIVVASCLYILCLFCCSFWSVVPCGHSLYHFVLFLHAAEATAPAAIWGGELG